MFHILPRILPGLIPLSLISPLAFQCDSSVDPEPVTNWSGTHSTNLRVHYPTTTAEVEGLVAEANKNRKKLRPMGSHLSPNGLSFADPNESVISLSLLDNILKIDTSKSTVTCQSGCRVSSVVDALRPHGLTLPQLASIAEQQIGGFISVAAHGTGHKIPTVDDFVDSFTVVTPALGTLTFSRSDVGMNKRMFDLILVGLGLFGVITEVTISCITAHNLLEHTFTLTREAAVQRLPQLLATHKYVRYMWIPYTDTVVVVTNDPFDASASTLPTKMQTVPDVRDKLRPFTEMLLAHPGNGLSEEEVAGLGMGEVRDALLALGPLDVAHVKRVNAVEAEFWKHATGYQYKPSDQLLQFDCGGSQWVQENCFKVTDGEDMRFMTKLLVEIEARNIPAPSPIEQRWSAGSRSRMSPAAGAAGDVFSWVGIIMYLPTDDGAQRSDITARFQGSYRALFEELSTEFAAVTHWAKQEIPRGDWEGDKLAKLRRRLGERFPLEEFESARKFFDPHGICQNELLRKLIGPDYK